MTEPESAQLFDPLSVEEEEIAMDDRLEEADAWAIGFENGVEAANDDNAWTEEEEFD